MALTRHESDPLPPNSQEEMRVLVAGLVRASRFVFAGLSLLALSLFVFTLATAGAADVLSDRRLHYTLIAGIVLLYVYLQRA